MSHRPARADARGGSTQGHGSQEVWFLWSHPWRSASTLPITGPSSPASSSLCLTFNSFLSTHRSKNGELYPWRLCAREPPFFTSSPCSLLLELVLHGSAVTEFQPPNLETVGVEPQGARVICPRRGEQSSTAVSPPCRQAPSLRATFLTLRMDQSPVSGRLCVCAKSLQSCLTLCDPAGCSLTGSSVHGILQARTLEWLTFPPPGDLPDPGMEPASLLSPALAGGFFTTCHHQDG